MGRTISVRADRLFGGLLTAFVTVIGVEAAGIAIPIVRATVVFTTVTFVPSALVLALAGVKPRLKASNIVYSIGISLLFMMGIGVVLNLLLPVFGHDQPLTTLPVGVSVLLVSGVLITLPQIRQLRITFSVPTSLSQIDPRFLFFSLFPLWSILAVTYLNVTHDPRPVIIVLGLIAVTPALVVTLPFERSHLRYGVPMIALAVLYHKSLWISHTFGGHASVVNIWEVGYWPTSGEVLLPNAVLMPVYAHLLGLPILTTIEVIMPLLVLTIPLASYLAFERYVAPVPAFLAASVFIFAHPFYFQYASAPRAPFPVLFLALIGAVIADRSLTSLQSRLLAVLFAPGIAVSHYGTSYYVMFAMIGSVCLLVVFRYVEELVMGLESKFRDLQERERSEMSERSWSVLTPQFTVFYVIVVISWYLFAGVKKYFRSLIEHILNAYQSLFVETGGHSSTVSRLSTDYGSLSIGLSKSLYLTLAMLLAFGFAVAYCRRFLLRQGQQFDDDFLALSTLLFSIFGISLMFSGEWGGGRPMMIVFSLGAVFCVVGMYALGDGLARLRPQVLTTDSLPAPGGAAFAIILAVFFVLNSGVMSAVAFGGEAPSNVPVEDLSTNYDETDIEAHAWLADQRNVTYQIYGDQLVWAQATDWINGEIAAKADRGSYRFRPKYDFEALESPGVENGYLLLNGNNVVENDVMVNYIKTRKMSSYNLELDERNRIYSNGKAMIYFTNRTTE